MDFKIKIISKRIPVQRGHIQFVIMLILLCFIGGCTDKISNLFNGKVSRYPHSKIVKSMRLEGGCYAEIETNDSWKKVLKYYKYHMSKAGWTIRVEREPKSFAIEGSESTAFLALFKNNTGLMIDVYPSVDGDKTRIALFMENTDE